MNSTLREELLGIYSRRRALRELPRDWLGLEVLGAALALGLLGYGLVMEEPLGINVSLWILALLVAVGVLARRWDVELKGEGVWMAVPAVFFALAIAWRASPMLLFLNVLAILTVLALGAYRARGGRLRVADVGEYLWGLVGAGLNATIGILLLTVEEVPWKRLPGWGTGGRATAVLRGTLIAIPALLVFGALFAAADPIFERLVGSLFRWDVEWLVAMVFWTGFWAWISAGFLRQTLFGVADPETAREEPIGGWLRVGGVEVITVLALLNALFLAFVLVQFRYLFGGATLVEATTGLSYAEYARRGFFELVTVAMLLLPLLLVLDAVARPEDPRRALRIRVLMAVLIGLLFVVLFSAVQRMRLYQNEYGLTELRLYTSAFMCWLAVVFLWFVLTVLRGRRERFAWGALVAGLAALGTLNLLNPDALIARTNIRLTAGARDFDARYLGHLSADAVPTLVAALPALDPPARCRLAASVVLRYQTESGQLGGRNPDWRTWNRGRARARRVLRDNAADLRRIACPEELIPPEDPATTTPSEEAQRDSRPQHEEV